MIPVFWRRLFFAVVLISGLVGLTLGAQEEEETEPNEPVGVGAEIEEPTDDPVAEDAIAPSEIISKITDTDALVRVVVIPVRDQIAEPILYVIRRGLKAAIEQEADLVVLDMKTPGGSLGATFEILEALGKFKGDTATFVNDEAISAGSFISAMTDDIYFAPQGIIGAAAPVMSTGGEIDESMKQKIVSYLKARIRAISEGHTYRGQVISAMIDADYELKIGDEVLKEKGELLSLTATEAAKMYGDPPEPLLAAGIFDTIDDLLDDRFGEGGYVVETLVPTWSEDFAAFLNSISPLLLGLGFLGLFIEFKTPGFGVFGVGGGLCLGLVFLGNYTAGLSGNEPMLFFLLGVVLLLVELILFPGLVVAALSGILLMLGSLVWAMADIWPNEPISFSGDIFLQPIMNLGLGLVTAVVLGAFVLRFLPRGWFWDRMVLAAAAGVVVEPDQQVGTSAGVGLVGRIGAAVTDLYPSGQVEIDSRYYDARVEVGTLDSGRRIRVVEQRAFGLVVEAEGEEDVL